MAFEFIFESNFEQGSNAEWDSETDSGTKLDFPHYSELARIPNMEVPFRGAYCMRWTAVTGDANPHYVQEGDLDIADTATAWLRFYLFIGTDFKATADDIFNIYEWQKADNTPEAVISLQITASTDLVDIAIADGIAASSNFNPISKGVWHCIEAKNNTETNATGTLDLIVDGVTLTSLTSVDSSAAVTHGTLGPQDLASTTTGTLLFDQFVFDDGQIFPIDRRFPETLTLTKTSHVFVGPGRIDNITLVSGTTSTNHRIQLWDTDTANTNDASAVKAELANTAAQEIVDPAGMPVEITRGAYIVISGTVETSGPRAVVQIGMASAYSVGRMKEYGIKRGGV
jgi:hypothetical protein